VRICDPLGVAPDAVLVAGALVDGSVVVLVDGGGVGTRVVEVVWGALLAAPGMH
jgi:hypothetical protein